ncbi:MAG: co-chaperone GroES [Rickettsiales bacterium]|jgi:chaperonin GroES|nr:co-chaperone GroES [Rickettsiales bacterium]
MVKFKPLHNFVLLEKIAEDNKTAGGIIIPDTAKEKPSSGKVIAVGPGIKDEPMTVKAGDVVLFGKWASTANEVKIDGQEFILIKESEILGII